MGRVKRARGFRFRFAFLTLLCLSLTLLGAVFFIRSIVTPDTGLIRYDPEVESRPGGVFFFPSAPFAAPSAAGLLAVRDRIVSLNGRPIGDTRDLVRAALAVRDFGPYTLQVERDGATPVTLRVTPYFRPSRADWVFELVFCVMLALAAFTLCWKLPHEPSTVPLAACMLLSLLFTCIRPFSYESVGANLVANVGNIGSWLLVIFAMLFPWKRGPRTARTLVVGLVIVLYVSFCILRASLFARWMATGTEILYADYRRMGQLIIVSDGVAYVVLAVLLGSAYARSRLPRDKRMLQWMLAGVLIGFPPYFFLDQLPLILGGPAHQIGLGSLAQLFLSILPLFLLLALTQSRAINLRAFLTRYGMYGTLIVLTIALFGVVYIPLKSWLAGAYGIAAPLPEIFAAGLLVLAIGLLRIPIERLFVPAAGERRSSTREGTEGPNGLVLLAREEARAQQALKLTETRSLIRGVVRALHEPLRILSAAAARGGTVEQKEAGAEASFFLEALGSFAGSPSSPLRPTEPGDIVRSAIQRVAARFPGIEFIQKDANGVAINCCPGDLVQAVGLLLENAAEATEGTGAPVRILCSADRARVAIEIVDQGAGIDGTSRRHLFSPFSSTKPGHRGLGLYFVRMIVERNDGVIDFTSGDSRGTIVRLTFPRV